MQHRIATITQKLHALGTDIATRGLIDVDLMLDYTRVLYADLQELRQSMAAQRDMHIHEPTLDELTEAMLAAEAAEDEAILEAADPTQREPALPKTTHEAAPVAMVPQQQAAHPFSPKQDLFQRTAPMAAPMNKKLLFEDMIGINDRYLFQQELFHNDHVLYHKAVEAINAANSLEEVNDWLEQQVSGHRNWDLYSEAGSTFYAILNRYFEQK